MKQFCWMIVLIQASLFAGNSSCGFKKNLIMHKDISIGHSDELRNIIINALSAAGQELISSDQNIMVWSSGFTIEFERNGLFKLLHLGDVIAPFDDIDDLIGFILEHSN
jgi:hypothetical protein